MSTDALRPEKATDSRAARFLAQRGACVGAWILAFLGTLAAWAPFLANDRPYVLVATDHGEIDRARRELVPLAESLARAVHALDADGSASARSPRVLRDAVDRELRALEQRIGVLDAADGVAATARLRGALRELQARVDERVAITAATVADALVEDTRSVRDELAADPARGAQRRSFPLFAALDAVDVFVALLPIAALVAWMVRRRFGALRAVIAAAACALALAGVVRLASGPSPTHAPSHLKAAVARGTVEVRGVFFPPIPYGFAETNLAEVWCPPTWLGEHAQSAIAARFGEPSVDSPWRHLLGTDALGRDVAARVLWGGRVSLAIGLAAALLLSVIGTLLGAAAGFAGGRVDASISRVIEVVLCFPAFFLVLCAIAWSDPDVVPVPIAIVLVIAAVGWTTTARLVRAEALRVAQSEHVMAARALGLHPLRVLLRHVLPNSIGPALIAFGFAAGGAISVESSLAFLGLGAQVPIPSWGGLVGEARGADQAWAWITPGFCVFLAVFAWVLVAEAVREALDPRAVPEGTT